jgi:hypothetical protein
MAGSYLVSVTGSNGCIGTASVNVAVNANPTPAATASSVSCNGLADGSINLTVTGGNSGLSFNWSNSQTTQNISGLSSGTYTVTVTNVNNCTATATANVANPAALTATATSTGQSATCTPTGGTAPYSYLWSEGSTTQAVANLAGGTYTVTVTDAHNCTTTASVLVNGVQDIQNLLNFDLSPNPNNGNFIVNVMFNAIQDMTLDIYADNGQLIYRTQKTGKEISIPVDMIGATGIYMVVLRTGEGYTAKKVLVQ